MNEKEHEGILAIFLAEAEEIVQRLWEQLAELRYGYDGQRILDDIHRGFHTLYGGATVLKIAELEECAQLAERVMARVRSRRVSMTPSLASLLVAAISALELMLACRINHQSPSVLNSELKSRLLRAADRNNSPSAANNPLATSADPISVFFDDRLQSTDSQLGGVSTSVVDYAKARFAPLNASKVDTLLASQGLDDVDSGVFWPDQDRQFETLDVAAVTLNCRVSPAVNHSGSWQGLTDNTIGDLVNELSWVRQRLMKFRANGYSAELDKALSYLDLVTQDFEQWQRDHGSDGDGKSH